MREVIALFAESGTVDDIGIGAVRDAFSDLLFPGLSTVQTRPRYFLFVPWVYQRLAEEKVPSDRAEDKARQWEVELIESLLAGGATDGVIGSSARSTLKQLPSFIYWNGLRVAGIRQFTGTRGDYHRAMNRINDTNRRAVRGEADETIAGVKGQWHHNLPPRPADLWESAPLDLTAEEADYLRERFVAGSPDSLFAALLRSGRTIGAISRFPWDATSLDQLAPITRVQVQHARWFSESIHGAQLLYNVMLAEKAAFRGLPNGEEWLLGHRTSLAEWRGLIEARRAAIDSVNRHEFWRTVYESGANVRGGARLFIDRWLDLVIGRVDVEASADARSLIEHRERRLKKGLARLSNTRALENWLGAAGADQLTYRWAEGRTAVNDIGSGLGWFDV